MSAVRVHIVGAEAGGKTTLADRVAGMIEAPVHHLDDVAWTSTAVDDRPLFDPRYQPAGEIVVRPLDERLELVRHIAASPRWVTEGKYVGWTRELLEHADLIIWADHVRWPTACRRVLARAGRSGLREARRRRGRERFTRIRDYARHSVELAMQLFHLTRYYADPRRRPAKPDDYNAVTRRTLELELAAYRGKVLRTRRPTDVDAILRRLARSTGPGRP